MLEVNLKQTSYRIRRGKWNAEYKSKHGERITRVILDADGKPYIPSEGAYSIGKDIVGEPEKRKYEIFLSAVQMAVEMESEGAFNDSEVFSFEKAMKVYMEWRKSRRNNEGFEQSAKLSLEKFGKLKLNRITRKAVRDWIDIELAPVYAHNTVRNKVNPGRTMYNWLKREGEWSGDNPFANHEWNAEGEGYFIKSTISPQEWVLINELAKNKALIQAMTIAYYTGIRPTEVYAIVPYDFNHDELTLWVYPAKRKTMKHIRQRKPRLIAIPQALSTWAINWKHWRHITSLNIMNRIQENRGDGLPSLAGLKMETFRRNFISMMEMAGCPIESVDAHQGRYQNSVAKMHYLRDKYRAVNLMRPYIIKVFDNRQDSGLLSIVKQETISFPVDTSLHGLDTVK